MVSPPMRTISKRPLSNVRISSGASKRLRMTSSMSSSGSGNRQTQELRQLLTAHGVDVFPGLQHDTERIGNRIRIERVTVERRERRHPVDGLRHAGHFVQL